MSKILYPECHGETYLHKIINPKRTKVIHNTPGGVGWVLNQIKDKPDKKLIGIIDNDNSLPSEFDKYNRVHPQDSSKNIAPDINSKSGLKYYKHNSQNSFLIIQEPDLEGWLCKVGKEYNLFPRGSSINSPAKMKKITKQNGTRLNRNSEFKKFIKAIELLPDSPLKEIREFIENI